MAKYRFSSHTCIIEWASKYRKNGPQSLQRSRQHKTYSFQFKLNAVEVYLSTEIACKDLALSLGINTSSILASWVQRYRAVGVDDLKMQRKGRRPKVADKSSTSPTSTEEQNERLKQFEKENLCFWAYNVTEQQWDRWIFPETISEHFKYTCPKSGLKGYTLYGTRKTGYSNLVNQGIDPMVAAKIGRWVNPKVPSKHYYAVDDLTKENVMKKHLFASN